MMGRGVGSDARQRVRSVHVASCGPQGGLPQLLPRMRPEPQEDSWQVEGLVLT